LQLGTRDIGAHASSGALIIQPYLSFWRRGQRVDLPFGLDQNPSANIHPTVDVFMPALVLFTIALGLIATEGFNLLGQALHLHRRSSASSLYRPASLK
jgi:hypothetical protein